MEGQTTGVMRRVKAKLWILERAPHMDDIAALQLGYEIALKQFAAESGRLPQTVCCVRRCRRAGKCQGLHSKDFNLICIQNIEDEQQEMFAEMTRNLETARDFRYSWLSTAEKASTPQELILREVVLHAILKLSNARKKRVFGKHAASSFTRPLAPPPPPRLSSPQDDQPRIDVCPETVQPFEPFPQPSLRLL